MDLTIGRNEPSGVRRGERPLSDHDLAVLILERLAQLVSQLLRLGQQLPALGLELPGLLEQAVRRVTGQALGDGTDGGLELTPGVLVATEDRDR